MYVFLVKKSSTPLTGLGIIAITAPALPILFFTAKMWGGRYPFRPRWIIRAGWVLNLLSSGCFMLLNPNTPTPGWVFILCATGVSHALLISGHNICSNPESPTRKRKEKDSRKPTLGVRSSSPAFAIVMYSVLRTWGMCIAIPVGGCIVLTQMVQELHQNPTEFSESLAWQDEIRLSQDNREELGHVFLCGFRLIWRFFMGVSTVGGLSSLLIR